MRQEQCRPDYRNAEAIPASQEAAMRSHTFLAGNREASVLPWLLMMMVVTGCKWGTMPDDEFDRFYGDKLKGVGGISMFYGTEPERLAATIGKDLGNEVMADSITLYYNRAILSLQTPKEPQRKCDYEYEDSDLSERGSSTPISEHDAPGFYTVSDVPWKRIPEFVQKAHDALNRRDIFVRLAVVRLEVDRFAAMRQRKEAHERLAAGGRPDSSTVEDTAFDKGIRITFHFGESSITNYVEVDSEGNVTRIVASEAVKPGH